MQDCEENVVVYGSRVALQVHDGSFVQADRNSPYLLAARKSIIRTWEIFTVVPAEKNWDAWGWWVCYGHEIGLRATNGSYVQSNFKSGQRDTGELFAWDFTKGIVEKEVFSVRWADPSEEVRQQSKGRPVRFGDPFFLQANGNQVVGLAGDRNVRLFAFPNRNNPENTLRFIAPDAEAMNQLRQDARKVRQQLSQSREDLRRREADLQQREERAKAVEQQELGIRKERLMLQEWAGELKQKQEEVEQLQAFHQECAKTLQERDESKLLEFGKRGGLMEKAVKEFQERQELLKSAFAKITSLRQQRSELEKELATSPAIENLNSQMGGLKADIQRMEEQTAHLQRDKQECERLGQRRSQLEEDTERLLALVEYLPQLRRQVETLERRLTVHGQEAENLEQVLRSLTPELLGLQEAALRHLRAEVQEGLERASSQEAQLRQTERELRELEVRYARAQELYDERLLALQLYSQANRRVAEGLAIHGGDVSTQALSTVETLAASADDLLRLLDQALRAAMEANAAAGQLEHLDFVRR